MATELVVEQVGRMEDGHVARVDAVLAVEEEAQGSAALHGHLARPQLTTANVLRRKHVAGIPNHHARSTFPIPAK